MRIGPYALEGELGRGGMGAVYRGRDAQGRRVAVKVLTVGGDLDLALRFQREVAALRRLDHPAVAAVLDAGVEAGRPWLAMQLVEGPSLAGRLRAGGPLPWREAAQVVERVARGAAHAHARGVLHRDLKASNVLLGPEGPVLVDFGLVRAVAPDGSLAGLTRTGQVAGTPGYMAPEQALGEGARIGPATDVYGLGALLFEALTGRPPFVGASVVGTLQAVVQDLPEPPSRLVPPGAELPPALEALCLACLAKDPAARPPSAEALAEALEALAAARSPGRPLREARQGPRARRAARGLGALGLGALGLGALGLALRGDGGSAAPTPAADAPGPPSPEATPGGAGADPGARTPVALDAPAEDAALLAPVVAAVAAHDLAAARDAVARGLHERPAHPVSHAARAYLAVYEAGSEDGLARRRLLDDAEAAVRRAHELSGTRPRVVVLQVEARLAVARGDLDRAEALTGAARALAPGHLPVRLLALELAERRGHALTAWLEADALIAAHPEVESPHATRARLLLALGEHLAARVALEREAPQGSPDPELAYVLVEALAQLEPAQALARLEAAPAPFRRSVAELEALALARLGRVEQALEVCPLLHERALLVLDALLELDRFREVADLAARVLAADARRGEARGLVEARRARALARVAAADRLRVRPSVADGPRALAAALVAAQAEAGGHMDVARAALEADALGRREPFDAVRAQLRALRRAETSATDLTDLGLLAYLGVIDAQLVRAGVGLDALERRAALAPAHPAPPSTWSSVHGMRADMRFHAEDHAGAAEDLARLVALRSLEAGGAAPEGVLLAKHAAFLAWAGHADEAAAALARVPADAPERASAAAAIALTAGDVQGARAALGDDLLAVPDRSLALRVETALDPAAVVARHGPSVREAAVGLTFHTRVAVARAALAEDDLTLAQAALDGLGEGDRQVAAALAAEAALLGARGERGAARARLRRLGARVGPRHVDTRWALDRLAALPPDRPPGPAAEEEAARAVAEARDLLAAGDPGRAEARLAASPVGTPGRALAAAQVAVANLELYRAAGRAPDRAALEAAAAALRAAPPEAQLEPEAVVAAAALARALGRRDEATARMFEAMKAKPGDPVLLLQAARERREDGQLQAAQLLSTEAAEAAPDDPHALLERLLALESGDDAVPLEPVADALIARAPRWPAPYLVRAQARLARRDAAGALADALRAGELGPASTEARLVELLAWWHLGRPDVGLAAARAVADELALGGSSGVLLAWLLVGAGEDAEAVALARRLEGTHAALLGLSARVLERAGRRDEAVAAARALPPGTPAAVAVLARQALREGDLAGAERACAEALAEAPGSPALLLVRGLARWGQGDAAGAREDLVGAAEEGMDPAGHEALLALALLDRERTTRASVR